MHVTARLFLLRMVDKVVRIARERAIAAGRVRIEPTARFDGDVGRFLHRLDGKVPRRLDHDTSLTADPRDDGGPILVVMAAPGLAFLAATPWRAAQCLFPALLGLALVAGGMIQGVGFDRPRHLPLHLVGQGGIAQPPTPAIASADMHPQLFGNATRGTRQTPQKSGEHPVHYRALAAVQERPRAVMEGALAGLLFPAGALQS